MHELALDRRHRVEADGHAPGKRLVGGSASDAGQGLGAALAVARCVDDRLLLDALAVEDRVGEVLQRVDRLALLADQHAEVGAAAGRRDRLVRLGDAHVHADTERVAGQLEQVAKLARRVGLALDAAHLTRCGACLDTHAARRVPARGGDRFGRDHRNDPGRPGTNAEQAPLALAHDLELDGGAVDPGDAPLDRLQRLQLRLGDGIALSLDAQLVRHATTSSAGSASCA